MISRQLVLPYPHPASAPATTRQLRALDEDMDPFSEKEHAEEVNSERGPLKDMELLCWGPSPGITSLQCYYQAWNVL